MDIQQCPQCRMQVVPTSEGICPSCQSTIGTPTTMPSKPRANAFSEIDTSRPQQPLPAVDSTHINPYASPQYGNEEHTSSYTGQRNRGIVWTLFIFQGRIPRRTFWLVTVINTVVLYTAMFALIEIFGEDSPATNFGILMLYIPTFWISLAVSVKRWHDRDKSGWWVLIGVIPIIGPLWQLIETGCLRGTYGDNRYGPDPT